MSLEELRRMRAKTYNVFVFRCVGHRSTPFLSVGCRTRCSKQHVAGTHIAGTHIAGTHIAGTHIAGTHIAGTHIAGTHIAGTHIAGTHVVTRSLAFARCLHALARASRLQFCSQLFWVGAQVQTVGDVPDRAPAPWRPVLGDPLRE
jgi:hypothetical protein